MYPEEGRVNETAGWGQGKGAIQANYGEVLGGEWTAAGGLGGGEERGSKLPSALAESDILRDPGAFVQNVGQVHPSTEGVS